MRRQQHYAVSHPSLPDYLALIGGDTFGIHSDCTGCQLRASCLVDQLEPAGISWKAYYQGLPAAGPTVATIPAVAGPAASPAVVEAAAR